MQLFSLDLSLPFLLAAFSLCTSMLAVLGTVQLVVSAPAAAQGHHAHLQNRQSHEAATLDVGLGMYKRVTPWWGTVTAAGPLPCSTVTPLCCETDVFVCRSRFCSPRVTAPALDGQTHNVPPCETLALNSRELSNLTGLQAETQRRANARARTRLSQLAF
ncbi:hypothetical protein JB92DRAFT_2990809 [Gautieria morchelliformis]|nr:hypothetical protein JB92DRAFT_2990809 [Gautieria morchelliformis]